ncbi:GntR family transcriptional regulator [Acidisoma cladoniae]|uniref:GntR family transcriptional regulator n=1 Tax=Acidisoma cladoniae TaxID=3040935 RepID=UPI00254F3A85|nr:GntR family transcriptional regulator [Acidisoma sp. PAMC 29798]
MITHPKDEPEHNLAEHAYAELSRLILERALPGGSAVVEQRLGDQLGITRTPMREAMLRLAAERMLVKQGSRTFTVRQISASEYFQSMKVRELLECEAIRLAIGKIDEADIQRLRRDITRLGEAPSQLSAHWQVDDRLHVMFPDSSGNAVLSRLVREVRISTRLFEIAGPFQRVRADAEEHLAILDAFSLGDADAAAAAMRRHIRNLVADVLLILRG